MTIKNTQGFFRYGSDRVGLVESLEVHSQLGYLPQRTLRYQVRLFPQLPARLEESTFLKGELPLENRPLTVDELEARVIHHLLVSTPPELPNRTKPRPMELSVRQTTQELGVVTVRVELCHHVEYHQRADDHGWRTPQLELHYRARLINGVLEPTPGDPPVTQTVHVGYQSLPRLLRHCAYHFVETLGLRPQAFTV